MFTVMWVPDLGRLCCHSKFYRTQTKPHHTFQTIVALTLNFPVRTADFNDGRKNAFTEKTQFG